jgi:hypothetical protein
MALKTGFVERHYLLCPFCNYRTDLETHRCMGCGALAVSILWDGDPRTVSPELVMVGRSYGRT